ncbi:MAG TPA: hypothetical protein VN702_12390 [Acetobacteraceae bacterium]|nr:hypothetical protein [Acetobacteraceae bacterium]
MPEHALPPARHEHQDVSFRPLLAGAVLLAAALLVVLAVTGVVFPVHRLDQPIRRQLPTAATPRLQPDDRAEMPAFYAQEMQRLHSAGWVDRQNGIVHIPIDQAMQDIAQRGIPGWPTGSPAATNSP